MKSPFPAKISYETTSKELDAWIKRDNEQRAKLEQEPRTELSLPEISTAGSNRNEAAEFGSQAYEGAKQLGEATIGGQIISQLTAMGLYDSADTADKSLTDVISGPSAKDAMSGGIGDILNYYLDQLPGARLNDVGTWIAGQVIGSDNLRSAAEPLQRYALEENARLNEKYPVPPEAQEFFEIMNSAEGEGILPQVGAFLRAFRDSPDGAVSQVAGRLIGQQVPSWAGGAAIAYFTKNPQAAALFAGMASGVQEAYTQPIQFLADSGVDLNDPQSIANALADKELMAKAARSGIRRGQIVGTADYLLFGLAGKAMSPNKLVNLGAQAGAQSVGASGGELTAQLASNPKGKPVNIGDVLLEGVFEGITVPVDMTVMGASYISARVKPAQTGSGDAAGGGDERKLTYNSILDDVARGVPGAEDVLKADGWSQHMIDQAVARRKGQIDRERVNELKKKTQERQTMTPEERITAIKDAQKAIDDITGDVTPPSTTQETAPPSTGVPPVPPATGTAATDAPTATTGPSQSDPTRSSLDLPQTRPDATVEQLAQLQTELFGKPTSYREMTPEQRSIYELERDRRYPPVPLEEALVAGQATIKSQPFIDWFKKSAAVMANGVAQIYYHGTGRDIRRFGGAKSAALPGTESPFFLTPDPEFASEWAEVDQSAGGGGKKREKGSNVLPVFVSAQNPFDADNLAHVETVEAEVRRGVAAGEYSLRDLFGPKRFAKLDEEAKTKPMNQLIDEQFAALTKGLPTGFWQFMELPAVQKSIRKLGHDGFFVKEASVRNLAVFSPTQIKSVFNRGTFSNEDPDLDALSTDLREGGPETLKDVERNKRGQVTVRKLAEALEKRQRDKYGKVARDDYSQETLERLAEWMALEILFELRPENIGDSAYGWYSEKFQEALDIMAARFPELGSEDAFTKSNLPGVAKLQNSKNARNFFTVLLAMTSDGQRVKDNFALATQLYERFRYEGEVPTDFEFGGQRNASMFINAQHVNELLAGKGPQGMHEYLLEENTVSYFNSQMRAEGETPLTRMAANETVPRAAAILGPKLGAFYANLMGSQGYLTMDMWWTRTFNRYRGQLIPNVSPDGLVRVKDLITRAEKLPDAAESMSNDAAIYWAEKYALTYKDRGYTTELELLFPTPPGKKKAGVKEPSKKVEKEAWLEEAKRLAGNRFNELYLQHQAERAANTVYKDAMLAIEEAPFGAKDRSFMIGVAKRVQQMLLERGKDFSIADIQAIIWYYEKRLYGDLGAKQSDDISYKEAAQFAAGNTGGSERSADEATGGQARATNKAAKKNAGRGQKKEAVLPDEGLDEELDAITAGAEIFDQGLIDQPESLDAIIARTSGATLAGAPAPRTPKASTGQNDTVDKTLTQIYRNFVKILNLTVRTGRITALNGTALGQYSSKTGVIRLKERRDFEALVHEAGHALQSDSPIIDTLVSAHPAEMRALAQSFYGGWANIQNKPDKILREGFAEFMRLYVTNPSVVNNYAPSFTAQFEALLNSSDPALLKGLQAVRQQYGALYDVSSVAFTKSFMVSGQAESFIQKAKDTIAEDGLAKAMRNSVSYMAFAAYDKLWDNLHAFTRLEADLQNAIEKRTGAPLEIRRGDSLRVLAEGMKRASAVAIDSLRDGVVDINGNKATTPAIRHAVGYAQGVRVGKNFDKDQAVYDDLGVFAANETIIEDGTDPVLIARRGGNPVAPYEVAEAQQANADLRAKYGNRLDIALDMIHQYLRGYAKKMRDAGLISDQEFQDLMLRKSYVPLLRDISDLPSVKGKKISDSAITPIKKREGSARDFVNPIDSIVSMTMAIEQTIAENNVMKAMALFAEKAGSGAGSVLELLPEKETKVILANAQQATKALVDNAAISPQDKMTVELILGNVYSQTDKVALFQKRATDEATGETVLFFKDKGVTKALLVDHNNQLGQTLFMAMDALGPENFGAFTDFLAMSAVAVRTGITSWFSFLVKNFIIDQIQAGMLAWNIGYIPFYSGFRGMYNVIRQTDLARDYEIHAGMMGGVNSAALENIRTKRDFDALAKKGFKAQILGDGTVKGMMKALTHLSELMESGTRVGLFELAYKRALKEGATHVQAAKEGSHYATDYINFGRHGSSKSARWLARTIPFLQVTLNGWDKLLRTMVGDDVAKRKGYVNAMVAIITKNAQGLKLTQAEKNQLSDARALWASTGLVGMLLAAVSYAFKDDPDYEEATPYLRSLYVIIPLGGGRIATIPKPREFALFANIIEAAIEQEGNSYDKFISGLEQLVMPPMHNPAIKLAYELATNYNLFSGQPLVPSYMEAVDAKYRAHAHTSNVAKRIGEAIGVSPIYVEHIITSIGTSAARDILGLIDSADPNRPAKGWDDTMIMRQFIRDPKKGGNSKTEFYNQMSQRNGEIMMAAQTYKDLRDKQQRDAEAAAYLNNLNDEQKGWAILNYHWKADAKRLHPGYRTNQVARVMVGVKKEMFRPEFVLADGETRVTLTPGRKAEINQLIDEMVFREMRNYLIVMKTPGWEGKPFMEVEPTFDMLREIEPDVAEVLEQRIEKAKIYDFETVATYWPELRDDLIANGEDADVDSYLRMHGQKPKKRKARE
jgi:hypothetical protein